MHFFKYKEELKERYSEHPHTTILFLLLTFYLLYHISVHLSVIIQCLQTCVYRESCRVVIFSGK